MKRRLIFQVSAFFFLIALAFSARAEYYLVYPGSSVATVSYANYYQSYTVCQTCYTRCRTCCINPCGYYPRAYQGGYQVYYETPRVVEMRYVSPIRHHISRGSEEVAEYAWIPYP